MSFFTSSGLQTIALAAAQLEANRNTKTGTAERAENHGTLLQNTCITPQFVMTDEVLSVSNLDSVVRINENDVLCGRGGETNHHNGNIQYRRLVKLHQRAYLDAKRRDKPLIAKKIVDQIRNQNPSGRFLKKIGNGEKLIWMDVGNVKAREKTSQALREGAPVIRDRIDSKQKEDADSDRDEVTKTSSKGSHTSNASSAPETGVRPESFLEPRKVSDSAHETHAKMYDMIAGYKSYDRETLQNSIINVNSDFFHFLKKRRRPMKLPQNGYFHQHQEHQRQFFPPQALPFHFDNMHQNGVNQQFPSSILLNHSGPLYGMNIQVGQTKKHLSRGPRIRIFKARMRMALQQETQHKSSTPPHRISPNVNYVIH